MKNGKKLITFIANFVKKEKVLGVLRFSGKSVVKLELGRNNRREKVLGTTVTYWLHLLYMDYQEMVRTSYEIKGEIGIIRFNLYLAKPN
jgi:hypothetical protein